ncbi:DHH family phosphoesterase [Candidatus Woesearchaeota archaeon]|nr:DHH family phosphoesterase [Candidatus Woesearchaeota archaeon]
MIPENKIKELRAELENSHRPLFFFDDDSDGLASFLLFYRFIKEGKGVITKDGPKIEKKYARKVDEYMPDKVFILDKPIVEQDFIDSVKQKIIWLDHHPAVKRKNIHYYNPRLYDKDNNLPTAYWAYRTVEQDLWIAMIGIVGDWQLPEKPAKEFRTEYPDLLPENVKKPEDALFKTKLGELIRIISFNLKGTINDSMKSVKVMTRIKEPYEILKRKTPAGKYLYKKYLGENKKYQKLMKKVKITKDKILFFFYKSINNSFTGDLSNELLYRHPDKIIFIAREVNDRVQCSLRSKKIKLPEIIEKSLVNINGYGGGHDHACGASISRDDFDKFLNNFRKFLKN